MFDDLILFTLIAIQIYYSCLENRGISRYQLRLEFALFYDVIVCSINEEIIYNFCWHYYFGDEYQVYNLLIFTLLHVIVDLYRGFSQGYLVVHNITVAYCRYYFNQFDLAPAICIHLLVNLMAIVIIYLLSKNYFCYHLANDISRKYICPQESMDDRNLTFNPREVYFLSADDLNPEWRDYLVQIHSYRFDKFLKSTYCGNTCKAASSSCS